MKIEDQIQRAYEDGKIKGENHLLKEILEQLLKIELIPKLNLGDDKF